LSGVQVEVWADMGTVMARMPSASMNRFIRRVLSMEAERPCAGRFEGS
jgi:hypothetical protein